MRVSNPVLSRVARSENAYQDAATYKGIALKAIFFAVTSILPAILAFMLATFFYGDWIIYMSAICPIVALVFGIVSAFKPKIVKVTGTLYTLFEGFAIGVISCVFSQAYSGVVFSALLATFVTYGVMTVLYATGLVRPGRKFASFMMSALFSIILVELLIWVMSLFSPGLYSLFYGNSILSIVLSAAMCLFAAFMILLDLNNATAIVENGMSKEYEWQVAFGLVLDLIWLYLEFLRLFSKIAARSNN